MHATWDDAAAQVREATRIYQQFYNRLAVPTIVSKRPDWDKFPGADYTMAVDALMPDGKTLQVGTAHHLGDNFAKTFDITYEDPEGEQVLAHQTCYGVSERCIAALISIHGDNKGLILPPEVAPTQVVIIPILFGQDKAVLSACNDLSDTLKQKGMRVVIDDSDARPGAKYYKWELKGVPIRIEIGPRDLKNNVVVMAKRDGDKTNVPNDDVLLEIDRTLKEMHSDLYKSASESLHSRIKLCSDLDEVKDYIQSGIAGIAWCGERSGGLEMEEIVGAGILGEPEDPALGKGDGTCPVCGKPTDTVVLMARTY